MFNKISKYLISAVFVFALVCLLAPGTDAASRFETKGKGTVVDTFSGLMWPKDLGSEGFYMPIQIANSYVADMNHGMYENYGYNDWRIPTVEELASLIEQGKTNPPLPDGHPFRGINPEFYWTASGGKALGGYAWIIDMSSGVKRYEYASYCIFHYLWPVRTQKKIADVELTASHVQILTSELDFIISSGGGGSGGSCEQKKIETPPGAPVDVAASPISSTQLVVTWEAAPGSEPPAWYNVYENGSLVTTSRLSSASVAGVAPGSKKCFTVSSFSASGLESQNSREICATTWSVKADRTVWGMGLNNYGQLGDGTRSDARTPVLVKELANIKYIAAGVEHSAAIKMDGSVWTWGRNNRGQLGNGSLITSLIPIKVEALQKVTDVSLGWYHSLALKSDGTVWAWGRNYYGQLGDRTRGDRPVPVQVRNLTNIMKVAAGWYHSIAISRDGRLFTWGWDYKGQLGNGEEKNSTVPGEVILIDDVVDAAGGMYHTLALRSDGTVWAWGSNEYGQLGYGKEYDAPVPIKVKGLQDVIDIATGMHYSLALKADGTVWAWGRNDYGQLGNSGAVTSFTPVQVKGVEGIKSIEAGAHHALAVDSSGNVWLWGWDFANNEQYVAPAVIGGLKDISEVSAGVHFTSALRGK
jgi:hypothetical protein